jgi:hypothetical protein
MSRRKRNPYSDEMTDAEREKFIADRVNGADSFTGLAGVYGQLLLIPVEPDRIDANIKGAKDLYKLKNKLPAVDNPIDKALGFLKLNKADDVYWRYAGISDAERWEIIKEIRPGDDIGSTVFQHMKTVGDTEATKLGAFDLPAEYETTDQDGARLQFEINLEQQTRQADYDRRTAEARKILKLDEMWDKERDLKMEIQAIRQKYFTDHGYYDTPPGSPEDDRTQEIHADLKKLRDRSTIKSDDFIDASNKIMEEVWDGFDDLIARHNELVKKRDTLLETHYQSIKDTILEKSTVTEKEATAWAKSQKITQSAKTRLSKIGYKWQEVQKDMAEFYRLTNGKVAKCTVVTKGHRRARAAINSGTVYLDSSFNKSTLFHEMGHLVEAIDTNVEAARAFVKKRATGSATTLRKLVPGAGYRYDEIAYPDDFISPYVGKKYPDCTEVFSMGLQYFSDPQKMFLLSQKDPEHFSLMMGFVINPQTEFETEILDRAKAKAKEQKAQAETAKVFYKKLDKAIKGGRFLEGTGYHIEPYVRWNRKRPSAYYFRSPDEEENRDFNFFSMKNKKYILRFAYLSLMSKQIGDGYKLNLNQIYSMVASESLAEPWNTDFDDLPELDIEGVKPSPKPPREKIKL